MLLEKKADQRINNLTIFHSLLQEKKQQVIDEFDFQTLQILHFESASIWAEEGLDFQVLLKETMKAELLSYKYSEFPEFYRGVQIITSGEQSCDACQKLEGKVFTIKEALSTMPLPCEECTFELYDGKPGWCRYIYQIILEND